MRILKNNKKGKSSEKKVIGAFMPLPLIEYITLHSLSTGSSYSEIIENLVTNWIENEPTDDEAFIKSISQRYLEAYRARLKKAPNQKLSTFLKEVETELNGKNITNHFIKPILTNITNGAKKGK